jgi:hypothetical protein
LFSISAYGITTDGFTTYINASNCTLRYRAENPPVIFDMTLPSGFTKEDLNGLPSTEGCETVGETEGCESLGDEPKGGETEAGETEDHDNTEKGCEEGGALDAQP